VGPSIASATISAASASATLVLAGRHYGAAAEVIFGVNSDPLVVHVEFATYFGGVFHRLNLTAMQENMISGLIGNPKNMLPAFELNRLGLIRDIFCSFTSLHLNFCTRAPQ
jgi:hypothetical protein